MTAAGRSGDDRVPSGKVGLVRNAVNSAVSDLSLAEALTAADSGDRYDRCAVSGRCRFAPCWLVRDVSPATFNRSTLMLDAAAVATGGAVLDVDAGAGSQTLAAARRVG